MSTHARNHPFDQFDLEAARRYDSWYAEPAGRLVAQAEEALLADLLRGVAVAGPALEIGCGTGHFSRWLASWGLRVVGLDASGAMLAVAAEGGGGPVYVQGAADRLPFEAGSFDLVAFVTSLEFVPNQRAALREACRVARRAVLLGVLNLTSPLGLWRKLQSLRRATPYRGARFFTPWSLRALVRGEVGARMVRWTSQTTVWPAATPGPLRALPFGAFIGALVELRPPEIPLATARPAALANGRERLST